MFKLVSTSKKEEQLMENETVRQMTQGQLKDIAATAITAIPELTFDEAQCLIGKKKLLAMEVQFAIRKLVRKAVLRIKNGYYAGTIFEIVKKETLIGRNLTADIVIQERSVAREHAIIKHHGEGDNYSIEDLQSPCGTEVNGRKYRETHLSDGDTIRFGRLELVFTLVPISDR